MTKSITGRVMTEREMEVRRKGAATRRLPPELRKRNPVRLTDAELALIRQMRAAQAQSQGDRAELRLMAKAQGG